MRNMARYSVAIVSLILSIVRAGFASVAAMIDRPNNNAS